MFYRTLSGLIDDRVRFLPESEVFYLVCTDEIASLSDNIRVVQHVLSLKVIELSEYCKILL